MASLTRPISTGCWAIRLSCKSNPPNDTKNTWRLLPKAVRPWIRRATILSWSANGVAGRKHRRQRRGAVWLAGGQCG